MISMRAASCTGLEPTPSESISSLKNSMAVTVTWLHCLRTEPEWVNPAAYGLVAVSSSEGRTLPYGRLEDILSRDSAPRNCHTNDDR